ncbi:MAG TPA: hypothetical protein VF125_02440 [Solirubrobacterales bacterium]
MPIDEFLYETGCRLRILMLPEAEELPAIFRQRPIDGAVSFDVGLQLRLPEVAIFRGLRRMLRAGVPEASVDKNRDPRLGEHHIRSDLQA